MSTDIKARDAFEEGYYAAIDGFAQADNPYPTGCDDHTSWHKGYLAFDTDDNDA